MEKNIDNLDIVIGTKEEELWQDIKDKAEERVRNHIAGLEIDRKIVELAKEHLKNLKPLQTPKAD